MDNAKWWGSFVGGTDDSLRLITYFENKKYGRVPLSTVLHDLMLDKYLGKTSLQKSKELFFTMILPDGSTMEVGFDISIDPVIDLCAVLVEQTHLGVINTLDLYSSADYAVAFSIAVEKQPLKLLTDELNHFCLEPLSYDLADMVPEDDMMELAKICREIVDQLDSFYGLSEPGR